MVQVTLKTYENNKEVSETFNIKEMNAFQIKRLAKEINGLLKDINGNQHFKNALNNFFDKSAENKEHNAKVFKKAREEGRDVLEGEVYKLQDTLAQVGGELVTDIMGSMEILLSDAPETATELLSIASNIDAKTLDAQDPITFLDIFDAVVEINDIEKIVERLKKSQASLKSVMNALFPKKENQDKVEGTNQK